MRTGVICLISLLLIGCDSADKAQLHEKLVAHVGDMLDKELKEGLTSEQVERFLVENKVRFKIENGCVGNLGLSDSACSNGKTYSGVLPIEGEEKSANVYIFVHKDRGLLSYQYVLSYAE